MKVTVCIKPRLSLFSSSLMGQLTAEATPITKVTAMPMPSAVSTFLDTPMKGQMPRNWDRTKLLTRIAAKAMASRLVILSITSPPPYSSWACS